MALTVLGVALVNLPPRGSREPRGRGEASLRAPAQPSPRLRAGTDPSEARPLLAPARED